MVSTKCSEAVVPHIRHPPDFELLSPPDVDRDGDDVDGGIVCGGVSANDSSRGSRSFTRARCVCRGKATGSALKTNRELLIHTLSHSVWVFLQSKMIYCTVLSYP